jgi:hypothetical protein
MMMIVVELKFQSMKIKKHFNKIRTYAIAILALGTLTLSCKREKLAAYNTDPDLILNVSPKPILTSAIVKMHDNSNEAFYDNIRNISNWTQQFVRKNGNGVSFTSTANNTNNRYGTFYTGVGPLLIDAQKRIELMPVGQKEKYVYIHTIPAILKVYYAWYVSDVNGSLAYVDGISARNGGTFTPAYQSQAELYDLFDKELKEAVAILKTQQPVIQEMLGSHDLYFNGDDASIKKWIKAANSLRLKIAMRLTKRDLAKVKAIATEVLADNGGVINDLDDEWLFKAGPSFTAGGNWSPYPDNGFSGEKNVIDFLWNTKDPRLRLFFRPNSWTKANFDAALAQGKIGAGSQWDSRQYYGQYASPDANKDTDKKRFFESITIKNGDKDLVLDTISPVQQRLFQAEYNNGTGFTTFQIITYADVCFMRAELAARNITTESAEEWYRKGILASIQSYNKIAEVAKLEGYSSVTDVEAAMYLEQPNIKFNPAKALEQIVIQQYLNYYKLPNEAWALIKRTGMPNATTIMPLEILKGDGQLLDMPRRFVINYPLGGDLNYVNRTKAIDDMRKDPDFGLPSDIFGRIWWDKK